MGHNMPLQTGTSRKHNAYIRYITEVSLASYNNSTCSLRTQLCFGVFDIRPVSEREQHQKLPNHNCSLRRPVHVQKLIIPNHISATVMYKNTVEENREVGGAIYRKTPE